MNFAVYIPVGGADGEIERAYDVIDSVTYYSTMLRWIVIVDDSIERRTITGHVQLSSHAKLVVVRNPRRGNGDGHSGGLCVADFTAFKYIQKETDAQYVLKLDTDSLVISSFEYEIEQALCRFPDVGMLGVIGDSFGENRTYNFLRRVAKTCEIVLRIPDEFHAAWNCAREALMFLGISDRRKFASVKKLKSLIQLAVSNGYTLGQYCQGGGYVVSRTLLDSLSKDPTFADPSPFGWLTIGEDVIVGLSCAAMGLKMYDLSKRGEPFAIQPFCLPFSCEELTLLERSIIHSIKGSSEAQYRQYFQRRRHCME